MEYFKAFMRINTVFATVLIFSVFSVNSQISTPCPTSLLTSFTPCLNFVTGSSGNGASPTAACCHVLESLLSTSMDCACLIINGNVPFIIPALAISLPRACNSARLPIQCKSTGIPLPAPGPVLFGPTPPPATTTIADSPSPTSTTADSTIADSPSPTSTTADSPSFSPRASEVAALAPALAPASPQAETSSEITPASSPISPITPTANPGVRPVLTPTSDSNPSYIFSPFLPLAFLGIMYLNKY